MAFGRLSLSRNYELFAAIAFGDGGITENMPYPPRGLPPDLSLDSLELFFNEPDVVKEYLEISRSADEAESALEEYIEGYGDWAVREYQTIGHLPTPETYNHSWLNLNELKEALAYRNLSINKLSADYRALMAAMETLAREYSPERVRLVFCFGL
ncbi:MAG TPA: hypothetical protein VM911_21615 [Pyrinomonadaceae bacterium]|nr:hypothetical protein [Pyrinomonadaceae bacterium]